MVKATESKKSKKRTGWITKKEHYNFPIINTTFDTFELKYLCYTDYVLLLQFAMVRVNIV